MDERKLLEEMLECKDEIRRLQAEKNALEDRFAYLKRLYYQLDETDTCMPKSMTDLDEKIRTDGFVIGIMI